MFEGRDDIRQMEHVPGRSINLAMSVRALAALKELGLDEHIKVILIKIDNTFIMAITKLIMIMKSIWILALIIKTITMLII